MKTPSFQTMLPAAWLAVALCFYVGGFVALRHAAQPTPSFGANRGEWLLPDTPTFRVVAGIYAPLFWCLRESVWFDEGPDFSSGGSSITPAA